MITTQKTTQLKYLLTYENNKLKRQFIFDLPVSQDICGRLCQGCYALKAQVRFPTTVMPSRIAKYEASLKPDFTQQIINELTNTKKRYNYVRVHSAGEFYSQEYLNKWVDIATAMPNITFYAFTKRLKDFDFNVLKSLPNFVVINSQQFGDLNYGPVKEILELEKAAKTFACPSTLPFDTNTICGITCNYCMTKTAQTNGVLFVKH